MEFYRLILHHPESVTIRAGAAVALHAAWLAIAAGIPGPTPVSHSPRATSGAGFSSKACARKRFQSGVPVGLGAHGHGPRSDVRQGKAPPSLRTDVRAKIIALVDG